MNKKFYFKSCKTKITISGETVTISRKGFVNSVLLRLKTQVINLDNIIDLDVVEANSLKRGAIKITTLRKNKRQDYKVTFSVDESDLVTDMIQYAENMKSNSLEMRACI